MCVCVGRTKKGLPPRKAHENDDYCGFTSFPAEVTLGEGPIGAVPTFTWSLVIYTFFHAEQSESVPVDKRSAKRRNVGGLDGDPTVIDAGVNCRLVLGSRVSVRP